MNFKNKNSTTKKFSKRPDKESGKPFAQSGDKKFERKKRKKITQSYLYNSGLYYLERFPASIAHFKTVMTRKIDRSIEDHPDQDRDQALEWLDQHVVKRFVELGYLNDSQYARGLIRSLRRKGTSKMKIMLTLNQKGVDSELCRETLFAIDQDLIDDQNRQAAFDEEFKNDADHADNVGGDNDARKNIDVSDMSVSYRAELHAAMRFCKKKKMRADDYQQPEMEWEDQQKLKNKYLGRMARQGFSFDIAIRALETGWADPY